MKRSLLIVVALFMLNVTVFAQSFENQVNSKIDSELLTDMSNSKNDSELFPVIVMMSGQYDQMSMNQKTKYMDKKARREFVIDELKRFTGELQADVARVMTEQQRGNSVKDFKQFWVFNGFSCKATKNVIEIISEREDVAMVFSDKERRLIPEMEMTSQPADNVRGKAWNVTKVNADDVWVYDGETGYTGNGVVVAVIDTGVNYNHTDIVNNMWDDGNGNHGYDFVNDDNDPMDDHGHGTHCAGTVAGYGTNGTQTGVAPDAKIMAIKVLGANGNGSGYGIVSGIEFSIENGADILSLSLGAAGVGGDEYYRYLFGNILALGVPASVAAGNEGDELDKYPIPYNIGAPGNCPPPYLHPDQKDILPGGKTAVICVGATDQYDVHSYFTSVGPATWAAGEYIGDYNDYPYTQGSDTEIGLIRPDIAAPGSGIVSLYYANNTGYCQKSGTSMATPCNAGVIALMLEANPMLTPCEIDSILEHTAVRCEGSTKKNNYTGSGRIDAYAAVSAALGGCDAPTELTASLTDNKVTLSWNAAEDVESYSVFRNNVLINNSVTTTSFVDYLPVYGSYSYYVKSNCSVGGNSIASNVEDVNYVYPGPVVDLLGNADADDVTLLWEKPLSESSELQYGVIESNCYTADYNYWAQKYLPSRLAQYAGMAVSDVNFVSGAAGTYSLKIYNGDDVSPNALIASKSVTANELQWTTISLDEPVYFNYLEPLWITLHSEAAGAIAMIDYEEDDYANAMLLSNDEGATYYTPNWGGGIRLSASIIVEITDDDYTYNIYRDGNLLESDYDNGNDVIEYSYTENNSGFHNYHITTNYFGRESQPSNVEAVAVGSTNQFTGINGSDWSDASNWSDGMPQSSDNVWIKNDAVIASDVTLNGLYINDGASVTVATGRTLSVTGAVENNEGVSGLVLESDAAFISDASNVNATVKRNLTASNAKDEWAGKWHFISSSVEGQNLEEFIESAASGLSLPSGHGQTGNVQVEPGDYDFYLYHEPTMMWANVKADDFSEENLFFTENGSHELEPGRGYLASFANEGVMTFKGVVNQGETTISLTAEGSRLTGFNLVGNPYPCNIDWDAPSGWTRTALGDAPYIWVYNDDVDQYGAYQLGNHGVGTNGVTNVIASSQGFFVKAIQNGNLIINDDVKTSAKGTFRKGNDENIIKVKIAGKNGNDEVMICKNSDNQINAEKLFSRNENAPSLYLNVENEKYSIVNIKENGGVSIPMGFVPGKTGSYTISSDANVELVDNLYGNVTNLSSNSYEFIGSVADNADRFVVRVLDSDDDSFVYQNGKELIVTCSGSIQIIDCLGRVVVNEGANDGIIDVTNLNTGVYIVKINDKVQKIVIR